MHDGAVQRAGEWGWGGEGHHRAAGRTGGPGVDDMATAWKRWALMSVGSRARFLMEIDWGKPEG